MSGNMREVYVDLLRDPDLAVAYLKEAVADGDPRLILMAADEVAEAQRSVPKNLAGSKRSNVPTVHPATEA